ncbi:hypothetical protein C8Q75DRAFT_551460 [Abortiporus biennis]|nr:hypothetical protein C8Q75DRAFT_551460 [Abortiporus biennis]
MSSPPDTTFKFPSPVGGAPFPIDYAPSIVFSVLYGLLVPVIVYRQAFKHSRNIVFIGTIAFVIVRIVLFALRSEQAHDPIKRVSSSMTKFMQSTITLAYGSMGVDLTSLLLCVVVNATEGNPRIRWYPSVNSLDQEQLEADPGVTEEALSRAKERSRYRWICGTLRLIVWVPSILSIISGVSYPKGETDAKTAQLVQTTRYAGSIFTCVMITTVTFLSIWWSMTVRNIVKAPCYIIACLCTLLNVITVYQLYIMHFHTTSLTSTSPGSLNSRGSKICFYIFQATPEWLTSAILLSMNARQWFGTGFSGDRMTDKKK